MYLGMSESVYINLCREKEYVGYIGYICIRLYMYIAMYIYQHLVDYVVHTLVIMR